MSIDSKNYLEPRNSRGVREGVSLASPRAPKIAETRRSSTATTDHHCSNLTEARAAPRSEAPPAPPFPGRRVKTASSFVSPRKAKKAK